jgi:hypothetical protein
VETQVAVVRMLLARLPAWVHCVVLSVRPVPCRSVGVGVYHLSL